MVSVAQLDRALGCGPSGRGFESHHSPHFFSAPVAQLDRASDFESAGRPFEPGRARQLNQVVMKSESARHSIISNLFITNFYKTYTMEKKKGPWKILGVPFRVFLTQNSLAKGQR